MACLDIAVIKFKLAFNPLLLLYFICMMMSVQIISTYVYIQYICYYDHKGRHQRKINFI